LKVFQQVYMCLNRQLAKYQNSTWCPVLELVCVFQKKVVLWLFWIREEKKLVCKAHWYAIGLRPMSDFTITFPKMFFSNPWEAFKSTSKFLPIPFSVFWWNCWNLWRWKRFKKLGGHGIDGLCDKMLHLDIDKVLPESLWKNLI
jgi:hypothetical protein